MDMDFLLTTGQGVFETMRYEDGRLWFWPQHLQRLHKTLKYFSADASAVDFDEIVYGAIKNSARSQPLRVKLLALFPFNRQPKKIASENLRLYIRPTDPLPDRPLPLRLQTVAWPFGSVYPLGAFKTIHFGAYFYAQYAARGRGFDDVIFQKDGRLLETSVANIFAVKHGTIFTPPIKEGVLPGIIRALLVNNFPVVEFPIFLNRLAEYEYFFITNSVNELQPVESINDIPLRLNVSHFKKILADWRELKRTNF